MRNNPEKNILVFIFLAGFGVYSFYNGFKKLRRKRLIENIPTSKIRSMAMGLVEVSGEAVACVGVSFKGPFSRKECVFYKYIVERWEKRGKSSRWVTVAQDTSLNAPFYIEDNTAKAIIDPRDAEINFKAPDFSYESGGVFGGGLPEELASFLDGHGISYRTLFGNYRMRFREWDIYPRDAIYALGTAKKNSGVRDDFKRRLDEEIARLKNNPAGMKEADTNKDGTVSQDEWNSAVDAIREKLIIESLAKGQDEFSSPLVIGKGKEEKIFIISERSEKEFCRCLGMGALAGIVGGAALCIFAMAVLFYIFTNGLF